MKAEDRAYCAGLFEGEGCIRGVIRNSQRKGAQINAGKNRHIIIKIVMTDREPLDLFDDLIGFGTVSGPHDNGPGRKPYYEYCVTGYERVQQAVCQMWFWLSPRRKEQITRALKTYQSFERSRPSVGVWRGRQI